MYRGILSDTEIRTGGGRVVYLAAVGFLLIIAIAALFPFFFAFTSGLKNSTEIFSAGLNLFPETPLWNNYSEVWTRFNMPRLLGNSIMVVGGGVLLQLVISAAAAYSLSQLKPFGQRIIMTGFLLTLMVPGIAYFVPLYVTLGKLPVLNISLLDSYWGLWLPYSVSAFAIFVLKTFFDRIPPDILDSARIDGASSFQILRYIILPLSRSILIVICVLAFVNIWKDFLLPQLVLRDPITQPITARLIYLADNYGINLQMAASFIALLPPLLIAAFLQRYMTVGLSVGGVKG
jgi:multiple sugar transport system permease protein